MDKSTFTKLLVKRLKNGDEEAFRQIYEGFWERLYKVSFYYTRSREDSEDILINIFTSLWNNRSKIEIEYLESYLAKAVKNQSLKCILKQQRLREQMQEFKERVIHTVKEADSPESQLEVKELSLYLDRQVQSLPEKTKKIFLLNREDDLTYKQIAQTLGVSIKTVEYHISKALALLSRPVIVLLIVLWIT